MADYWCHLCGKRCSMMGHWDQKTDTYTCQTKNDRKAETISPLERAARAVCDRYGHDPDSDDQVGLGEPGDVNWNMYEDDARAVMQALREPSEAMVRAGDSQTPDYEQQTANVYDVWQAMLDAALEEG